MYVCLLCAALYASDLRGLFLVVFVLMKEPHRSLAFTIWTFQGLIILTKPIYMKV